jgi:TatD-related deoxyribonuclease
VDDKTVRNTGFLWGARLAVSPLTLPILDNHFHIQEHGMFLEAVRVFHQHGGTHVTHIPIPGHAFKATKEEWRRFFEAHLRHSDRIEAETPVRVIRAVGPYPIEFVHAVESQGMEAAKAAFRHGYAAAFDLLAEQKAVVLGEVGRAHFPVAPEIQAALNEMLEEAFARAAELDVAVILHTEHATHEVFEDLAMRAKRAGFGLDRLIKHYSPPAVRPEENAGLFPSIIASKSSIQEAIGKGTRFLMETDFIDEPTRPNVVLPPYSVPKRTKALLAQGVPEGALDAVHREHPQRLFRVVIEAGQRVALR